MEKIRKNIDLSPECVELLSIRAIKQNPKTDFKNLAQQILEQEAINPRKKAKK